MFHFNSRAISFLFLLVSAAMLRGQTTWTLRNPTPTDAAINQVAFGASRFVAVGSAGSILISSDGQTWTSQPRLPGRPSLRHVMFGGGRFVALDDSGISYTSPDGSVWTKHTSTGGAGPVAFGNSTYLTLSTGNLLASSTDAATWTQRTTGTTLAGTSVDFGNNVFVVATNSKIYLTSPDAVAYTPRSFPTGATVSKIVFGNNSFVAHLADGTTAQSTDAITWQTPTSPVAVRTLGVANNRFFAIRTSTEKLVTSTDGIAWTDTATNSGDMGSPAVMAYGAGVYVSTVVSYAPNMTYSSPQVAHTDFYRSSNGEVWQLTSDFFGVPKNVAYGLGLFIAGNHVSSDGINWSPGGFGPTLPVSSYPYYGDVSFTYRFVGSRFFALRRSFPYQVFTSADGVTSTLVLTSGSPIEAVSYGAGRYVTVAGYNSILTSTDTLTWSSPANAADYLTDLVFGDDRFVATSSGNKAMSSIDGLTWSTQTLPTIAVYSRSKIAYGNGAYVIIRENGETFTSADAVSWKAQPTQSVPFASLAFANGTFVAGDLDGNIHTSADGITWTKRDTQSSTAISELAYGNGQWVGVSRMSGTVLQSNTTSGAAIAPSIVLQPSDVSAVGGDSPSVTLIVGATGTGPFSYQWYKDGVVIPDATEQTLTLTLSAVTTSTIHSYRVTISGAGGTASSASANVTNLPPQPPTITSHPASFATPLHANATLYVAAVGSGPFSYTWLKNGQPFSASAAQPSYYANSPFFTLYNVAPSDAGEYQVIVTGRGGSVTSNVARLTVKQSRLINLSARAKVGTGDDALFAGFVLANDNLPATGANWTVLARAAGPALKSFGLQNVLTNPVIDLYQVINGTPVLQANNDNWGSYTGTLKSLYSQLTASVGAFEFAADSLDAGLIRQGNQLSYDTTPQVYSAIVKGGPGESGVALVEFYDASSVHARMLNLSARARVGAGEDVLIAGFVITGTEPLKVLLRGVGPGLASQGLTSFLANPKLTLFNSKSEPIQSNDTWGDSTNLAELVAASAKVGAFALPNGSADAAMLLTLQPGVYSVQISSVDGKSGIGLAEIYEVP